MFEPEHHLFIFWPNAVAYESSLLAAIKNKFIVSDVISLEWNPYSAEKNYARFYGEKLPSAREKLRHCGTGPFKLVLVLDESPIYEERITTNGEAIVNANMFDIKKELREFTGGGHLIHGSDSHLEARHNCVLLLGRNLHEIVSRGYQCTNDEPIYHDIMGALGWDSFQQLFQVLNECCEYVVLRNHRHIHLNHFEQHDSDIDLLVDDVELVKSILGGEIDLSTGHIHVLIARKMIRFELYERGTLLSEAWECEMFRTRVQTGDIYHLCEKHELPALAYHALFFRNSFSEKHQQRLKKYFPSFFLGVDSVETRAKELVKEFLLHNDFKILPPDEGYFNFREEFSSFYIKNHRRKSSFFHRLRRILRLEVKRSVVSIHLFPNKKSLFYLKFTIPKVVTVILQQGVEVSVSLTSSATGLVRAVGSALVLLLMTTVLVKTLGREMYGVTALITSINQYLSVVLIMFSGAAFKLVSGPYYSSGRWNESVSYYTTLLAGQLLISLSIFAALLILLKVEVSNLAVPSFAVPFFILAAAGFLISSFTGTFSVGAMLAEKFYILDMISLMSRIFHLAFLYFLILLIPDFQLIHYGWSLVVYGLCLSGWTYVSSRFLVPQLRFRITSFSTSKMKTGGGFGFRLMMNAIGIQLYTNSDLLVISLFLTLSVVADYGVALQAALLIAVIGSVVSRQFNPTVARLAAQEKVQTLGRYLLGAAKNFIVFLGFIAIPFAVFPEVILYHWLGSDFISATPFLIGLTIFQVFHQSTSVFSIYFTLVDKLTIPLISTLIAGVLNVVVSYSLLKSGHIDAVGVLMISIAVVLFKTVLFNGLYGCYLAKIQIRKFAVDLGRALVFVLLFLAMSRSIIILFHTYVITDLRVSAILLLIVCGLYISIARCLVVSSRDFFLFRARLIRQFASFNNSLKKTSVKTVNIDYSFARDVFDIADSLLVSGVVRRIHLISRRVCADKGV